MKVLFNEYPLGSEEYNLVYKTGIYRVVWQLAHNLSRAAADPANRLEVTFHSTGYLWAAYRFFENHLRGPGTRFAVHPFSLVIGRLVDAASRFCLRTAQNRHPLMRAFRWAITRAVQILGRADPRLADRTLAAADIYHSPFVRIPAFVDRHRHLRRFTTIYDLIPITHPEYFDAAPIEILRGVVGSLGPQDFVTCISHATRAALLAHAPQLDPARVFVTHLAAGEWCRPEDDPAKIARVRAAYGLTSETPYFLTLCTLEPRKNLEAVVRAFARLRRTGELGPEHRLVLVGGQGWKTGALQEALQEAEHCRDAILQTGFVPDEQLPALYSGAQAFVYVSRLEGFGLPPLEAMQCGAPVITSNTSSLPEVVGDAGLTVDPDDLDGLAAHMRRLSRDPDLRRELSARSLERAKLFSWQRFCSETMAAYRAAMALA